MVPINKKKKQSQRCCMCNARRQACTTFKTVDVVNRYPEAMWLRLDDAKQRWVAATGGDLLGLERNDSEIRGRRLDMGDEEDNEPLRRRTRNQGKERTPGKESHRGKSTGRDKGGVGKGVNTVSSGRRQSGRIQSMKKRPAVPEDQGDEDEASSPSKRTRNIPKRNATPGPSGTHEGQGVSISTDKSALTSSFQMTNSPLPNLVAVILMDYLLLLRKIPVRRNRSK